MTSKLTCSPPERQGAWGGRSVGSLPGHALIDSLRCCCRSILRMRSITASERLSGIATASPARSPAFGGGSAAVRLCKARAVGTGSGRSRRLRSCCPRTAGSLRGASWIVRGPVWPQDIHRSTGVFDLPFQRFTGVQGGGAARVLSRCAGGVADQAALSPLSSGSTVPSGSDGDTASNRPASRARMHLLVGMKSRAGPCSC